MRIVGGEFRGRRFDPPSFFKARPTTDFAKESLFNILNNKIDIYDTRVLDLFSGTGSISYEFMSRGSIYICSVDMNSRYLGFIKSTAETLNKETKIIHTIKADVLSFLKRAELNFDIIFADPPYDLTELSKIPELIYQNQSLKPGAIVVLEHSSKNDFSKHPHFESLRKYGSVHFSFFK